MHEFNNNILSSYIRRRDGPPCSLQPYTPVLAMMSQYDPNGSAGCAPGQLPLLRVPAHAGSSTQKIVGTPSMLMGVAPAAQTPPGPAGAGVGLDVGTGVVGAAVVGVDVVGAAVVGADVVGAVVGAHVVGAGAGAGAGELAGGEPDAPLGLQPYTPEATFPQNEPLGRPFCGPGQAPELTSALQMGPLARQKTPRTPSTLISYSPILHCEPSVAEGVGAVVVVAGTGVGAGDEADVGAGAAPGTTTSDGANVVLEPDGAAPALQPYTPDATLLQ